MDEYGNTGGCLGFVLWIGLCVAVPVLAWWSGPTWVVRAGAWLAVSGVLWVPAVAYGWSEFERLPTETMTWQGRLLEGAGAFFRTFAAMVLASLAVAAVGLLIALGVAALALAVRYGRGAL